MWFVINVFMDLQEGIAVGRTFAALKNYQVDGNKEMMAIGLMNMAGSCSSCYVTTGTYLIQCPSQKFKQGHLQKKKKKTYAKGSLSLALLACGFSYFICTSKIFSPFLPR